MTILITILKIALVLVLGYLLTSRAVPWLFVKIARALGFKAQMTPITAKRITRFKRIRRGYFAFIGISTLFVVSLFLELLVSGLSTL